MHGLAPFRAALEEKLLLARYAWERLQQMPGFATVGKPDLSIVGLFADVGADRHDDFNRQLLDAIQAEGEVFLTSTRLRGKLVIRLAVMAQNSHRDDVDLALERLAWHRQRLLDLIMRYKCRSLLAGEQFQISLRAGVLIRLRRLITLGFFRAAFEQEFFHFLFQEQSMFRLQR